jgi:hypothetical protein
MTLLIMTLLIMTLLIMTILLTLNMGDINYNDIIKELFVIANIILFVKMHKGIYDAKLCNKLECSSSVSFLFAS